MTPKPYYQDDFATIYHGDCRELMAGMADRSVDLVITDPPYGAETHTNAATNAGPTKNAQKLVHFDPLSGAGARTVMAECGRLTRGWVVATMEWRHVALFDSEPPPGLRLMRFGAWVKPDAMPQLTADRPSQGWEAIAYLYRSDLKPSWNGGGKSGAFVHNVARGFHPTEKPVGLLRQWVELFSNHGDVILDPFMGSGSTLRAAKDCGRHSLGIELEERYCEIAAKRLAQEVLDFGDVA